ncbi:MAG: flavodoxin family protein [Chloroflexi bacterium]|jgi:flavodoxin|nr:flavodoxin family protein [Chloroflexota bacterium]
MKALVVYDSFFGNTEQIARAVGEALQSAGDVEVRRVTDVTPDQLAGFDLVIVGSPTRAFRPSPNTKAFLDAIPAEGLRGIKVAAFDTRIAPEDVKSGGGVLKFFAKMFGYAADPMAKKLQQKGGTLVAQPEGFYVLDSEGPLRDGELDRAADWARHIAAA